MGEDGRVPTANQQSTVAAAQAAAQAPTNLHITLAPTSAPIAGAGTSHTVQSAAESSAVG